MDLADNAIVTLRDEAFIIDHWSLRWDSAILVKVSCEIALKTSAGLLVDRSLPISGIFADAVSEFSAEKRPGDSPPEPTHHEMYWDTSRCSAAHLCPFTPFLRFSSITCRTQHEAFSLLVSNLRQAQRFPGWRVVVSAESAQRSSALFSLLLRPTPAHWAPWLQKGAGGRSLNYFSLNLSLLF